MSNVDILLQLTPRYNIQHVIRERSGSRTSSCEGPHGVKVLPASSGVQELTHLDAFQRMRLLEEFEAYEGGNIDVLLIDTSAGISENVAFFCVASREIVIVTSPEPTALTDAYALIKVLFTRYQEKEFHVLVNSARNAADAKDVYRKLSVAADRFLNVSLDYLGYLPSTSRSRTRSGRRSRSWKCSPGARPPWRSRNSPPGSPIPRRRMRRGAAVLHREPVRDDGRGEMKPAILAYAAEGDDRERIVREFLPFIRFTARRLGWRLVPAMSEDDLVSAGIVGLLDALQRFQPGTVKLKTYAEHRIRGAMLDELRAADTLPRNVRDRVNAMKSAHTRLEHLLGRMPENFEVAEAIGVSLDEYHKTLRESGAALHLRFEDFTGRPGEEGGDNLLDAIPDAEGKDPLSILERANMQRLLADVIRELPEKERLVLSLYYWDELTMREIGKVLGLTEGRVSQLHGQAVLRCKARLGTSREGA